MAVRTTYLLSLKMDVKGFKKGTKIAADSIRDIEKQVGPLNKKMRASVKTSVDMRNRFNMAALSFLFFGMVMMRITQTVLKISLEAYMKMTEGATAAGIAVSRLSAHWELLKFSIGEALAGLLMANLDSIINFLDMITEFVQKHPKMTAIGLLAVFFGAMAMMTFAQFAMLSSAISTMKLPRGLFAALGPGGWLRSFARTGLVIGVSIAAAWVGWKIGEAIGEATYESVGRDFLASIRKLSTIAENNPILIKIFMPAFEFIKNQLIGLATLGGIVSGAFTPGVSMKEAGLKAGLEAKFAFGGPEEREAAKKALINLGFYTDELKEKLEGEGGVAETLNRLNTNTSSVMEQMGQDFSNFNTDAVLPTQEQIAALNEELEALPNIERTINYTITTTGELPGEAGKSIETPEESPMGGTPR